MMPLLLIAVAVWMFAGPQIVAAVREYAARVRLPHLERRHVAAAALLAAAALYWSGNKPPPAPAPTPAPPPARALDLRGAWVGPTAAEDAATVAAMLHEVADELEHDGMAAEPTLKSGVAMDDLRQRAFALRCRGVQIGPRQPRARDAIKAHLDAVAGTAGGPLTPQQRAAWIGAYREVAQAAEASIR